MRAIFDNPVLLVVVLLLVVLLFGAKRLPDAARSIGRSMRIFKSEVKEMKDDGKDSKGENESTIVDGETVRESGTSTSTGTNGSTAADSASNSDGTVR